MKMKNKLVLILAVVCSLTSAASLADTAWYSQRIAEVTAAMTTLSSINKCDSARTEEAYIQKNCVWAGINQLQTQLAPATYLYKTEVDAALLGFRSCEDQNFHGHFQRACISAQVIFAQSTLNQMLTDIQQGLKQEKVAGNEIVQRFETQLQDFEARLKQINDQLSVANKRISALETIIVEKTASRIRK